MGRSVTFTNFEFRELVILTEHIKKGIMSRRKDSFKVRRSRMDIIADILSVAREETKKTQIVYKRISILEG